MKWIYFLCLFIVFSSPLYADRIWIEKDGIVIMEAERGDYNSKSGNWVQINNVERYSGYGYMIWYGESFQDENNYDLLNNPNNILTFTVKVKNPGTYSLKIRNYHDQKDGDNDVWVSVNRSDYIKYYDFQQQQWSWDETCAQIKFELKKGMNLIKLHGRSPGFAIDRLVLFTEDVPKEIWSDPFHTESEYYSTKEKPDFYFCEIDESFLCTNDE